MDTLVAKYSGSAFRDDLYSEEQQRDLTECLPPLSLKFDLPPVVKVSLVMHAAGGAGRLEDITLQPVR